jgi:hypothetical protein
MEHPDPDSEGVSQYAGTVTFATYADQRPLPEMRAYPCGMNRLEIVSGRELPGTLRRFRRRWPIRAVLYPLFWLLYGLLWLWGWVEGSPSLREPMGSDERRLGKARLPLVALVGPDRDRIVALSQSLPTAWLFNTTYAPPVRTEVTERGVRVLPSSRSGFEFIREIEIDFQRIRDVASGRYSLFRRWINLSLSDGTELCLLLSGSALQSMQSGLAGDADADEPLPIA